MQYDMRQRHCWQVARIDDLGNIPASWLYIFDVGSDGLSFQNKLQISRAAVTCLALTPGTATEAPVLVANVMDSTVCILKANKGK